MPLSPEAGARGANCDFIAIKNLSDRLASAGRVKTGTDKDSRGLTTCKLRQLGRLESLRTGRELEVGKAGNLLCQPICPTIRLIDASKNLIQLLVNCGDVATRMSV